MKKDGKAESTIEFTRKALTLLSKNANLMDPESVKDFVAKMKREDGYKRNLCIAYENWLKLNALSWERPKYCVAAKVPKIPAEERINLIIANASKKLGVALSMSRDTVLRPIELMNLRLRDIDLQNAIVYPETAKHGNARSLKLRNSTVNMVSDYLARKSMGLNDKIFENWDSKAYGKWFRNCRNRLAEKLKDPSIKSIRLYDLRHFFASTLYHKTKDILFVKRQMGHKK